MSQCLVTKTQIKDLFNLGKCKIMHFSNKLLIMVILISIQQLILIKVNLLMFHLI